ncbi:Hypothetical protein NTJ_07909 [Nesidiocoris tenuis]|uniref:Uncharacterized protein n=1 Tax=Nesidiocoris tenuis TaxID=355587 RepID=A0ABN7AVY3_9HEMI|nr:Hypothetical protein NTJ_07909 [Nesidiocoris tenuis]
MANRCDGNGNADSGAYCDEKGRPYPAESDTAQNQEEEKILRILTLHSSNGFHILNSRIENLDVVEGDERISLCWRRSSITRALTILNLSLPSPEVNYWTGDLAKGIGHTARTSGDRLCVLVENTRPMSAYFRLHSFVAKLILR